MKKLSILIILLYSITFTIPTYGEWIKKGKNDGGDFYVDFDRIRKIHEYDYWWLLTDFLKPNNLGYLSSKTYVQSDCKHFKLKNLSFNFYKKPMGAGKTETYTPKNSEWMYPPPYSTFELILKSVCNNDKSKY